MSTKDVCNLRPERDEGGGCEVESGDDPVQFGYLVYNNQLVFRAA